MLFYAKNKSNLFFLDSPLVSIIIPVHNNFNYTYNCISSILDSEKSISFEIIISNDNSNDETTFLKTKYFKNNKNIFVYDNYKTYNFLLNCKKAAKRARGKYILFLNNDTKVHKEWLTYLLKLIENDEKVGMVGSKLIYPDGLLQEAGGIVWSNGECLNFGKGSNSDYPEYNYVKEVDYISGIAIVIKKSLWKKIGGLNEKFTSENYAKIDLAFKIRKCGYKIIYQPKSIIEYHSRMNYRKDDSSLNQKIDNKIFIQQWNNDLENQLKKGNNFMARDRCINKSRIFVIDKYVPSFDKYAGDRCSFMYLNIFKEIGFHVTFLPSDSKKKEPYTTILQQNGIEVLYGNRYDNKNLEKWLKENLKYFKYIYLQRPDVSIKYIDLIKKYSLNNIIYFAHYIISVF